MTNPTISSHDGRTIARGSIEIRRQRVLSDVLEERVQVTNFNAFPLTLSLLYEFGADFADIFDVRGYEREQGGLHHDPQVGERSIRYEYTGVDKRPRVTRIEFDTKPDFLDEASAMFRVRLERREAVTLHTVIAVNGNEQIPPKIG